jgi:hypothetical protein
MTIIQQYFMYIRYSKLRAFSVHTYMVRRAVNCSMQPIIASIRHIELHASAKIVFHETGTIRMLCAKFTYFFIKTSGAS